MIVVADASPINILVRIGYVEVLGELFKQVLAPLAVVAELTASGAPQIVQAWANNPPPWFRISRPTSHLETGLGRGEAEAIALAMEVRANLLLVDDLDARRLAVFHGVRIMGTLGVLDLAARDRLIDLPAAVTALRSTDFRLQAAMLDSLLRRHGHGQ